MTPHALDRSDTKKGAHDAHVCETMLDEHVQKICKRACALVRIVQRRAHKGIQPRVLTRKGCSAKSAQSCDRVDPRGSRQGYEDAVPECRLCCARVWREGCARRLPRSEQDGARKRRDEGGAQVRELGESAGH